MLVVVGAVAVVGNVVLEFFFDNVSETRGTLPTIVLMEKISGQYTDGLDGNKNKAKHWFPRELMFNITASVNLVRYPGECTSSVAFEATHPLGAEYSACHADISIESSGFHSPLKNDPVGEAKAETVFAQLAGVLGVSRRLSESYEPFLASRSDSVTDLVHSIASVEAEAPGKSRQLRHDGITDANTTALDEFVGCKLVKKGLSNICTVTYFSQNMAFAGTGSGTLSYKINEESA